MLNNNKIKHLRSEAARVGYFDLPMAPVKHHAKSAIKKSYIDAKERTERKIRSYKSLKESFTISMNDAKERMQEYTIDTVEVMCTSILVFVIATILFLWKDLILAPISAEYVVPIGFLIAGATMGGVYTIVRKKQEKEVNQFVIYGIVVFVAVITFLFSLHSSDQIHILKSAVIAGFVGLIVFITNMVLLPTCKGTSKAFVYTKDLFLSASSHLSLIFVKQALNRCFSKLKNLHGKMIQESNEIESLLIIDFMLGKEANTNIQENHEKQTEKERYYA